MPDKLAGYQVLVALLGACFKNHNIEEFQFRDRRPLYRTIYEMSKDKPELQGVFKYRLRKGQRTSDDIDLCLRNLEDTGRLECANPNLVDFRLKSSFKELLNGRVAQLVEERNLSESFNEAAARLVNRMNSGNE